MTKRDDNENVTNGMLNEAVDAILEGMGKLVENLEIKMNSRFDGVETSLERLETDIHYVKSEIDGIKGDLASTPSRHEVEELKSKIEKSRFPLS